MVKILGMLILFVLLTYSFGLLYMRIGKYVSTWIQRNFGWTGFCIFGSIGVPFHEFTHWFMCKLFFHKVTDVSLFRPKKGKEDHILGYVKHEYKKRPWQMMGNFFIGSSPMILGCGVIILIFYLLYPKGFEILEPIGFNFIGFKDMMENSLEFLFFVLKSINFLSWKTWIFILFLVAISAHIDMSWQDVKNSLSGVIYFLVISWMLAIYLGCCFELTAEGTAGVLFIWNIYYAYFLLIGALINIIIGTIFKITYYLRRKKKTKRAPR